MSADTLALLLEAREMINDHDSWTVGENARDALHRSVYPGSPEACKWCLYGAIEAAALSLRRNLLGKAVNGSEELACHSKAAAAFVQARHRVALTAAEELGDEWGAEYDGEMPSSRTITTYNDNHRHQDVLALLDEVIENEQGESHGG